MKIVKYKKLSGNKYKIFLDDNSDIILHENIIIGHNLLIKKEISSEDMKSIIKDNDNYMVYDIALNYINLRMRCESEIIRYLEKKNIDKRVIDSTISKLKENGYLNERLYIRSYIADKVHLNNFGPNKIKSELLSLKLDKSIINDELSRYPKEDINRNLEKLIDKRIKSNRTYGESILRQKIINDFMNKGYDKSEIIIILDTKNLTDDSLYEKEYKKLYSKYSRKYSGSELEYLIKQKLYQKGLKKGND